MKQTHLLRNSYRFLIDLVYPNRCPCCNQVIAWDAWICEACQIETALNPDTVCSGCGKPFDDCMCSESLAFDGAIPVSSSSPTKEARYLVFNFKAITTFPPFL